MISKKHHDASYYRLLKTNMAFIIICVSLAPLIAIGVVALYNFQKSYYDKYVDHLETLVLKHKLQIDSFLTEKLADIKVLARVCSYEELSDEAFLQQRLEDLREEHKGTFVDLGVVRQDGLQVAYAGPFKLARVVYSDAEWFKQAMQSDSYISDVFLGMRGLPHFIVAVKKSRNGEEWILRATIDFMTFNSLVENIHVGRTGQAFILNRKGEFQTHRQASRGNSLELALDFLTEPLGRNRVDVFEGADKVGKKIISVVTTLKEGSWLLVYQQYEADLLSDLYHTRQLALAIFLIGAATVMTTAFILSNRMVNHIIVTEREKEMMNEQVIEAGKLASLGELAAGIAHEINNPVAIMVEEAGWIGDLLEEEEFGESENLKEVKTSLDQIRVQGRRCKDITYKLLSFARKTDPQIKEVQLNELIEEVVNLSRQRAKYSNVRIEMNLAPDLPLIQVAPSEIQQVLLNLVNNSIDAMDKEGGTLGFVTRLENRAVVVDVSDTGGGIPEANLPRIFDPFFTTKPVGKGTGLGLSICYGIIHKLGGEISVNSAVGIGTVFHVRLPLAKSTTQDTGSLPGDAFPEMQEAPSKTTSGVVPFPKRREESITGGQP